MTNPELYFDSSVPSPLETVAQMAAAATGAVVAEGSLTQSQEAAYIRTPVEEQLLNRIHSDRAPSLIVIGGSAGGGKSLVINQLLSNAGSLFGVVIQDATHAESPDQEQVQRLESFFAPFADDREPYDGKPLLIALNTGMALKFFIDSRKQSPATFAFRGLEYVILSRLGAGHGLEPRSATWLDDAVLVVNLDNRPTSGSPDRLFRKMLEALNPAKHDGLLKGAQRCLECRLAYWCAPRTNLELLSSETVAAEIDQLIEGLAMRRGREYSPRMLWDLIAQLVLGGINPSAQDPCLSVAEIYEAQDHQRVLNGLLPSFAFQDSAASGAVGIAADLADADPTLHPHPDVHRLIAQAGLSPTENAALFTEHLGSPSGIGRAAVATAAVALTSEERQQDVGRLLARTAWLSGHLQLSEARVADFRSAVEAVNGVDSTLQTDVIDRVALGLNAGFGTQAGPECFFPTERENRKISINVKINLLDECMLNLERDPIVAANRDGSEIVGYRPLHFSVSVGGSIIQVTMPLWTMLNEATLGKSPSSTDLERFHALRRSLELAGKTAGQDPTRPLLVCDTSTGARYRVAHQQILNNSVLRVTEVVAA